MKNTLDGFVSFVLKFLLTFLTFLLVIVFALGGMLIGAFSEIEKSYAQPVMEKIQAAGYFTCTNNQAENTEFLLVNCPVEFSKNRLTNAFLSWYPNTESLLISGAALYETINQVDLPQFPDLSTIPDFQGLFDIVEKANKLGPFSFLNMMPYVQIAFDFMSYFSLHGDELMAFMASDTISELQTMIETSKSALLSAQQGMGYVEVLRATVYPKKQIEQSAIIGLVAGVLVIQVVLFGIRSAFLLIKKRIRGDQPSPSSIE